MKALGALLIALFFATYSAPARADGRGLEIAGATLTAVGGASFIAGVGLMANDLAPNHGCGCGGLPLDWLTMVPLGGAMLIAGVPMLVVGYKRVHKQPREHVAFAPNQLSLHF